MHNVFNQFDIIFSQEFAAFFEGLPFCSFLVDLLSSRIEEKPQIFSNEVQVYVLV